MFTDSSCNKQNIALRTIVFSQELTLSELRTSGLRCTKETCWSSQLPEVLNKSSILAELTVLYLIISVLVDIS